MQPRGARRFICPRCWPIQVSRSPIFSLHTTGLRSRSSEILHRNISLTPPTPRIKIDVAEIGRVASLTRPLSAVPQSLPCSARSFYTSEKLEKKAKKDPGPEPYRFTTSPANVKSMPDPVDRNENQPLYVGISLMVFLAYFLYLREENDLDEKLNVSLFERVPGVEEPHLRQAIPRMRERGEDTTEVEKRLKELVRLRQEKEKQLAAQKGS